MAVAIETSNSTTTTTTTTATTAPVKKGGRGLSFDEKRRRLSEYFLEKVITKVSNFYCFYIRTNVEGLFPIKRLGKIGTKSDRNCYPIGKRSFTKFSR